MNLELYKPFFYTAKHGSISKASEQLFITQPAVSRSIMQLEDALDCRLFLRTSKGVRLTQEGQLLLQYVEQAFNFLEAGVKKINDMKDLLHGEVRIGVSDTLCKHYLISYLKLFKTLHPDIRIKVTCPTTPVTINLLKSEKIDFGIINLPYEDDALCTKSLLNIQDCFVAGQKFKALSYQVQPLGKIAQNPLLLLEKSSNSRQYIDQYFLSHSLSIAPDLELGNMDLLVQFAKNDFGIACVIKNFVEEDLDNGSLFEIKPIQPIPPRSVGVAWLKDFPLSQASKELISYLDYNEVTDI